MAASSTQKGNKAPSPGSGSDAAEPGTAGSPLAGAPLAQPVPEAERGLRFECTQCGKCCWTRGEYSHVYLTKGDLAALANAVGLTVAETRKRYTFRDENGFTELDFAGGRCVMLDEKTNLCTVYESRPTQCRTFPFWPEMIRRGGWTAEAKRICEGVGNGRVVPKAEAAERIAAQKKADAE